MLIILLLHQYQNSLEIKKGAGVCALEIVTRKVVNWEELGSIQNCVNVF